jgi:hypothetical protein
MSRAPHSPISFQPEKFLKAGNEIIQRMMASDEASAKESAAHKQPDHAPNTKLRHLETMLDHIFISTGGSVECDGVRCPIFTPSDNRVLLFFDTVHSFANEKPYSETELSRLSGAFGSDRIIQIKNMMNDGNEHATSSRDFAKHLMNWMVKESGINHGGYFADIADSRAAIETGGDDRFSVFDKIRAESAFEAGIKSLSATSAVDIRYLAGKTGIPSGVRLELPQAKSLQTESRAVRA